MVWATSFSLPVCLVSLASPSVLQPLVYALPLCPCVATHEVCGRFLHGLIDGVPQRKGIVETLVVVYYLREPTALAFLLHSLS